MNRPTTLQVFRLFVRTGLRRVLNRTTLAKEMISEKKKSKGGAPAKVPAPRTGTIRRGARRSAFTRILIGGFIAMMLFGTGLLTMIPTFTTLSAIRLDEARKSDVILVHHSDYEKLQSAAALTNDEKRKAEISSTAGGFVDNFAAGWVINDMRSLVVERFEAKGLAAFRPIDSNTRWSGDLALLNDAGRTRALKSAGFFLLAFNLSLALSWFGMMGSSLKSGDSELAWLFQFPVSRRVVFLSKLFAASFDNPAILVTPIVAGIVLSRCGYTTSSCFALAIVFAFSTAFAFGALRVLGESFLVHRCTRKTRGSLVATATMLGSLGVMFAINTSSAAVVVNAITATASAIPKIFYCNPFSVCFGTVTSDAGMATPWWLGVPLGALVVSVLSVSGCARLVSRGIDANKDTVRGTALQMRKIGLSERLFRGLVWKEVTHMLRQRALIMQMILAPIPILFVMYLNNPERALSLVTRDAATLMTTLFGVFSYAIMCSAGTFARTELTTLWFLQSLPRSLADCVRTKARVWGVLAIVLALSMLAGAISCFTVDLPGLALRVPFLVGYLWLFTEITYGMVSLKSRIESEEKASICPTAWIVPALVALACGTMLHGGDIWSSFALLSVMFVLSLAIRQRQEVDLRWMTEPVEKPPARLDAMHALVAILAFIGLQSPVASFFILTKLDQRGLTAAGYYGSALLVSLVFWWWMRSSKLQVERLDRPTKVWKPLLASVATVAAVGAGLVGILQYIPEIATASQLSVRIPTQFSLDQIDSILIVSMIVIAAPLFEEWIFRGVLYRSLRKSWGIGASVAVTTLLFTVIHPAMSSPAVITLSILTCLLVEKTGRVWPGIVVHMTLNLVVVAAWNLTAV